MIRTDLLERLDRVAPALSDNNLIPILSHFWFRGGDLLAYNDKIAISTKLDIEFDGAIPGDTFYALLSASRAKEISIVPTDDNSITIKAASSRFKMPFLPVKQTEIFEMPAANAKKALPVNISAFLDAIESCMRSLKEDTSMPDSLGITIQMDNSGIKFYATNDATISFAHVKVVEQLKESRVVLSGDFCRQMLSLSKTDKKGHIEIYDDYSLFKCGDSILFGRLVSVPRPLDFDSVIESTFPASAKKQLISIPTKLEMILERAIIITESKTERPKTSIVIKDDKAAFYSKSERGEVHDSLLLESGHPAVEVDVEPRLIKNGYGFFEKMILTEKCVVMVKGSSLYLVSASS